MLITFLSRGCFICKTELNSKALTYSCRLLPGGTLGRTGRQQRVGNGEAQCCGAGLEDWVYTWGWSPDFRHLRWFCHQEGAIQLSLLSVSVKVAFWLLSLVPPFPPFSFPEVWVYQISMNASSNFLASWLPVENGQGRHWSSEDNGEEELGPFAFFLPRWLDSGKGCGPFYTQCGSHYTAFPEGW